VSDLAGEITLLYTGSRSDLATYKQKAKVCVRVCVMDLIHVFVCVCMCVCVYVCAHT